MQALLLVCWDNRKCLPCLVIHCLRVLHVMAQCLASCVIHHTMSLRFHFPGEVAALLEDIPGVKAHGLFLDEA